MEEESDVIVHSCVLVDRFHTCMKIYPPEHTEGASKDGQKGAAQQQKALEARFCECKQNTFVYD